MQTKTLKYLSFSVGDYIEHKTSGYLAKIVKFHRGTKVDIEILDTQQNSDIWKGYKLPCIIKVDKIAKSFKHPIINPKLDLK